MPKMRPIFDRYWSLAAALTLPIIELVAESVLRIWGYYEITRAILSVVCVALLVHSWLMQRRYAQSRWRLAFWTLFLCFVVLGPVWLGLNVLRAHFYPRNWATDEALWGNICELQYRIEQLAKVLGIAVALWAIIDFVRRLVMRIMRKH
jgi:hypothetical protein